MLTHDTTLQTVRISLIALAALALAAFGALSATPRFQPGTPASESIASAATPAVSSRASVGATIGCGQGAYVSGDMVGDASPSTVYETLCGGR